MSPVIVVALVFAAIVLSLIWAWLQIHKPDGEQAMARLHTRQAKQERAIRQRAEGGPVYPGQVGTVGEFGSEHLLDRRAFEEALAAARDSSGDRL